MDGGLIQSVSSDNPAIEAVIIIDYDIEGCEEPLVKPFGTECRIMAHSVLPLDKFDVIAIGKAAQEQAELDGAHVPMTEEVMNG